MGRKKIERIDINLYDLLGSEVALSEEDAIEIWNRLVKKYKKSQYHLAIDFSDMRVCLSDVIKWLFFPLLNNGINVEWVNFTNYLIENTYNLIMKDK